MVEGATVGDAAPAADSATTRPWYYFWTWLATPHIEFGAVYVGMIVVLFLDMSLLQSLIGIVIGTGIGALSHGLLTAHGARLKVPPMVLSRLAFGHQGNAIPATIMAIISGVGWFIVNTVVGALALNSLFGLPTVAGLAIMVIGQLIIGWFGLALKTVQRFVFPVVTGVMVVAGVVIFTKVDPATDPGSSWDINGLIAIVIVACMAWAYTIGWNPYATDYSDYTPATSSPKAAGIGSAIGLFCSTTFLMMVGVAAGILATGSGESNPTGQFTAQLPEWLGVVVLCALIVASASMNSITLRSAQHVISADALGLHPVVQRLIAPVMVSAAGFLVGWAALGDVAGNYEGFIMVLGFWVGPWLNVTLVDQYLRRRTDVTSLLYDPSLSNRWGLFSILFAIVGSVCIYAIQIIDGGRLPHGGLSYACLGMLVGFYLAGLIYGIGLKRMIKGHGALGERQQSGQQV